MKRIPSASAMILIAMALSCRPVGSSPLSTSDKQQTGPEPKSDRQRLVSGQPQQNAMQPDGNLNHFYQPTPGSGPALSSRPSSQMFDNWQSMQPKDSYPNQKPDRSTSWPDSIHKSLGGTSIYRPNSNDTRADLNYARPDSLVEGSGVGPSRSNGPTHKPRLDDTEDSGDDDEDKDDDYDYGDTLDSGSGHGHIVGATQSPSSTQNDASGRLQSNGFQSPFRQPFNTPDLTSSVSSTKLIAPTRAPTKIPLTSPMPTVASVTSLAPMGSFRPTIGTSTSRDFVLDHRNKTRGEVDYDYDDGSEDDDSEDSSIFEDNDPLDVGNSRSNSTFQRNSTTNQNFLDHKRRYNTTKLPNHNFSGSVDKNSKPSPSIGITTISAKQHTTPSPATPQTLTSPPALRPTATQTIKLESRPGAGDPKLEEDKRAFEDDDDDDDDDQDDEDQKDDIEEEDDDFHSSQSNSSISASHHNKLHHSSRPVNTTGLKSTKSPNQQSSRPSMSPSLENSNKSIEYQTSTTRSKANVIISSSTSTTQSPVPILVTSTNIPITTTKMPVADYSPKLTTPVEMASPKITSLAQPTRSVTSSSTTLRPQLNFATDKPATRFTTSMNVQPSNGLPQTKGTTSLSQYENSDTLTRQVYEKAVEVYMEADRTVRAAWQAVWPSDINLESSVMEPLLNQPLFFMLALGGTVICLVLLFLLVVYIITYQIQPKDDDSSIY